MSAFLEPLFLRFESWRDNSSIASSSFVIYKEKRKRKASTFFFYSLKNLFLFFCSAVTFFSSQSLNILGQLILRSHPRILTLVVIGLTRLTLNLALALHLALTLSQQNLTGSHVVLHWIGRGVARHAHGHTHWTPWAW